MPFNSNTYHAKKNARTAWEKLAEARVLRERVKAGEAYAWEASRLPLIVQYARWDMKRSVFFRNQAR